MDAHCYISQTLIRQMEIRQFIPIYAEIRAIFPVLYEGMTVDCTNPFAHQNDNLEIDFEYLHIQNWNKLIDILEQMN